MKSSNPTWFVFAAGLFFVSVCPALAREAKAALGSVHTPDKEAVRLAYELTLTTCRGPACRPESVAKGETQVSLEREESELYGWTFVEKHAGGLEYQLRFFVGHELQGKGYGRGIRIGFAGRITEPKFKQVTWAEKKFEAKEWRLFPAMSVDGTSYLAGEEKITPTLHVRMLKVIHDDRGDENNRESSRGPN